MARALRDAGMPVVAEATGPGAAQSAISAGCTGIWAPDTAGRSNATLALLSGEGAGWPGFVLVDTTGGYSAQDVLTVATGLLEQPDRVILAERAQPWERGMLFRRERSLGSFLFRALHNLQVADPWCTLRGVPRAYARDLLSGAHDRRGFWLDMLLALQHHGIKTANVIIRKPYRRERGATTRGRCMDLLRIAGQTLRYVASSLTVMLVDTGLFSLFFYVILSGNRPVSLAIGRFSGAFLGYFLNRSVVFHQNNNSWRREAYTAGKYAILVAINYVLVLPLNYLIASGLIHLFQPKLTVFISKLLADLVLYVFTFFVNRELIFRRRRRPNPPDTVQN